MDRERAIDYIEGMTGAYGSFYQWEEDAIRELYIYVCTHRDSYNELTTDDAKRVGITL